MCFVLSTLEVVPVKVGVFFFPMTTLEVVPVKVGVSKTVCPFFDYDGPGSNTHNV